MAVRFASVLGGYVCSTSSTLPVTSLPSLSPSFHSSSSCCNIDILQRNCHLLILLIISHTIPLLLTLTCRAIVAISEAIDPSNKIWINFNKHTFVGGDVITGTVEMDCLVPFTARGVNIKFTGYSSPLLFSLLPLSTSSSPYTSLLVYL